MKKTTTIKILMALLMAIGVTSLSFIGNQYRQWDLPYWYYLIYIAVCAVWVYYLDNKYSNYDNDGK
jgi:hypothetical protein